ncbi:MAG: hypothetical protein LBC46_03960 [Treponema sp.]|jgi:hypothetical protein|nr:hypothetical protein [Treponema sp.]
MADYIPGKSVEFLEWVENFSDLCNANLTKWNLQTTEVTNLNAVVAEYVGIYATATGPNASKADVLLKNKKQAALKEIVRIFKRRNIDPNPAVSDPDRERLRLPIYDTKLTPVPAPSTAPEFEFTYPGARRIDLHFKDFGSNSKAKPKGVAGAVICYEIRDTAPANQEQLLHSVFTGRTPYHFEFKEEDRGKKLYVALFWQNGKGEQGPWSEIQVAIIP